MKILGGMIAFRGGGSGGVTSPLPVITSSSGTLREGELFLYKDGSNLSDVTGMTVDGVACTNLNIYPDGSAFIALAPFDGVLYSDSVTIVILRA